MSRVRNRLVIRLLVCGLVCAGAYSNSTATEDSCYTEVYSDDTLTIDLFERESCDHSVFDGNGFIIESKLMGNEITKILWGEASIEADRTDYLIYDLDKNGINEVVTLFSFCSTAWGYLHIIHVSDSNTVELQTLKIPDSLLSEIDYSGNMEVVGSSIVIYDVDKDTGTRIEIKFDKSSHAYKFDLTK